MNDQIDNSFFVDRARDIPFNEKEIAIISSCSFWMKLIGYSFNIIAFILGIISIGVYILSFSTIGTSDMLISATVYLFIALLSFFLGRAVFRSGQAFKDVLNTAIDDQGFLVVGFTQLQRFFLALGILIFLGIVILIITTILWSYSSLQGSTM